MNKPARYFIRTSLICLLVGLFMAGILSLDSWLGLSPVIYPWRQAFTYVLVIGWCTQFLFGLAYWKLWPKAPGGAAWTVYFCLNAGLVLRIVTEPIYAFRGGRLMGALVALAGLLPLVAALVFVLTAWGQIMEGDSDKVD